MVREFDLVAQDVGQGRLLRARGQGRRVSWSDADTLYVGTDFGPGSHDRLGLPAHRASCGSAARRSPSADRVTRARPKTSPRTASRDHTQGFERDFVYRGITFFTNEVFCCATASRSSIDKPDGAERRRAPRVAAAASCATDWTVGGRTYPAGVAAGDEAR